jgi:hypothetical protein
MKSSEDGHNLFPSPVPGPPSIEDGTAGNGAGPVYPWRISCPVCGAQVAVRPRAIEGWDQDIHTIELVVRMFAAHSCVGKLSNPGPTNTPSS